MSSSHIANALHIIDEALQQACPTMPLVISSLISDKAGMRYQFQPIKISSFDKIKNVFLAMITFGYWINRASQNYKEAVEKQQWRAAATALKDGAFIPDWSDWCINLIQNGNDEAAAFVLCQLDNDDSKFYNGNAISNFYDEKIKFLKGPSKEKAIAICMELAQNIYSSGYFYMNRLKKALKEEDYSTAKLILEMYPVDQTETCIPFERGIFKMNQIKFLVENGLSVNAVERQDRNMTLLWYSVIRNRQDLATYLLEQDASTEIAANFCTHPGTPLRAAVSTGNVEMVKLLLKFGADPHRRSTGQICSFDCCSAYELALSKNNPVLIQLLSSHAPC